MLHRLRPRAGGILPNAGYYGWVVVGTAMVCSALSSPGQSFALSLYIEHLIRDVGISRVQISSIYAGATLAAAATLPLFGAWADRTSARRFMGVVLIAMAGAMVMLSQARGVYMVVAALFALRMLGQGAIGLGTLTTTVRWFRRYRGRALAIVTLGYALGELVFPAVIVMLSAVVGWRGSLLVLGGVYAVVAAPVIFHVMRERRPEDEPMDGAVPPPPAPDVPGLVIEYPADPDFSLKDALGTGTFWAMLLVVSISPMLLTAVIFHQVALFGSRGWAVSLVPAAFAAYALASVATTYASGVMFERRPVRFGVSASLLTAVAGLAWFMWGAGAAWSALAYGALLGASSGIAAATNSLVWPEYYGIRALGALKGVVNAVRNAATAAGPLIVAVVFRIGGTSQALLVLGAIAVAGAVAAVFIRPPARGRHDASGDFAQVA
ncbi:MAG: MFS transporter [Gemmatimonadetes bacterium]|nr:MFS transporter [Gemmatimonadota bacterium]